MSENCIDLVTTPLPGYSPGTDILNPNYVEPSSNQPAISILIYIGTTAYQFNKFYANASLEIEDYRGFERGNAKFTIVDDNPLFFNLPFVPLIDQKIEIWNQNQTDLFFSGRIAEVKNTLIVRRDNGTEVLSYQITCTDRTVDLERVLISERYLNVKTGFIVKDVISRFTFLDASTIDANTGVIVTDVRVSQQYPSQVIQRMLDIEATWTFWYNPNTLQCYYGPYADTLNLLPIEITESNVYEIFDADTFTVYPDRSIIRNRVKFFFNNRYQEGSVSVAKGSKIVFGQGTEFTTNVKEGAQFRISGSSATYNVERVETDLQLRLSSEFQEDSIISGTEYEITGSRFAIVVEDTTSIAQMALINNEAGINAGVYEYIVPNDSNSYTRAEARQIANAHLLRFVQPLVKGDADTYNSKLTVPSLRAGQTIRINLPVSRQVVADVVIQKILWKDTGALLERAAWGDPSDTRIDPLFKISLDFQDRQFDVRNQIKRLMADVRRITANDNDLIEDVKIFGELVFVDDCIELNEPLLIDQNELDIEDDILIEIQPEAPFYIQAATISPAYICGANYFSSIG